jgi:hypothetical protein
MIAISHPLGSPAASIALIALLELSEEFVEEVMGVIVWTAHLGGLL